MSGSVCLILVVTVCTLKAVFELLTSVFGITEYNWVNSDNVPNIILICNMITVFILI